MSPLLLRLALLVVFLPAVLLRGESLKADNEEVAAARTMTYWAGAPNMTLNGKPSCMLEFHPGGCTNWSYGAPAWQARLDNIAAHRQNVTGIIPALHAVVNGGLLGHNGDGSYQNFLPYLPKLKAMELEVLAFLGNAGRPQQAALEATIRRGPAFIRDAIAMAKQNGYDGYSWDHVSPVPYTSAALPAAVRRLSLRAPVLPAGAALQTGPALLGWAEVA
jgi:hypothetical protein